MSPEDAERLAIPFGLTYLSREGYAKLAELLEQVIANVQPQPVEYQRLWEIVKAPPERPPEIMAVGCPQSRPTTARVPPAA